MTQLPFRFSVRCRPITGTFGLRMGRFSKGGMCVRTPKPIERGAQVKVQRGSTIACGEVRYCVPVGDMFHVGIRLLEVLSGSDLW